jgi:hypothetical protein
MYSCVRFERERIQFNNRQLRAAWGLLIGYTVKEQRVHYLSNAPMLLESCGTLSKRARIEIESQLWYTLHRM